MNLKTLIYILILSLTVACNNNANIHKPKAENAVLDISSWDFEQNGILTLSGKWEFYWKQLINPAKFDSIKPEKVTYFDMPGYWGNKTIDGKKLDNMGFATYRLNIISKKPKKLSMFIAEQMTAYTLWCNKKLIYKSGKVAKNRENSEPKRTPAIIDIKLRKGNNEIVFQISNFHHRLGGFYLSPTLGEDTQIYETQEFQRAYEIFLIGSLFIMGLYFFTLFVIRTFIPGTLPLSLLAMLLSLRTSLTGSRFMVEILPDLAWSAQYRLEYFTNIASPIAILYFLESIYKREISKKVIRIYLVLSSLLSLSLLFDPLFFTRILGIHYIMLITMIAYLYWRIITAVKNKRGGAKTVAFTTLIFLACTLLEILQQMKYINLSIEVIPLGTFVLVFGQIMALTKVFANLIKEHETLTEKLDYRNKNLDVMVKEKMQKLTTQKKSLLEKNEELQIQNEEIKSISHSLNRQKRKLEYNEKKLLNLLQLLPEAIFEIDKHGKITYANDEFYKYVKYDKNIDLNINDLVNENDYHEKFITILQRKTKENELIKNLSLQIKRSDNTNFPALFSIIKRPEDKELAYRCMFMDITSQVADEKKIIDAYKEISIKNKDITDSIQYAHTMQQAIMPEQEMFETNFSDYFIINKPLNIVSGDFYYISQKGNKVIFALSDCTGHGVPGGFMTMLGITLLNEFYGHNKDIPAPDFVLNQMRTKIIESLDQKNKIYSNKDGMDMILCILDTETLKLDFASANQPMLILRDKEILKIKGDAMPLGIYLKMKDFTANQIQLQKNDILYLFSDGVIDAFGGKKNRKLHIGGLSRMIMNCYKKPLKEQGKQLEKQFFEWQGKNKQIDDVLIIGIKI